MVILAACSFKQTDCFHVNEVFLFFSWWFPSLWIPLCTHLLVGNPNFHRRLAHYPGLCAYSYISRCFWHLCIFIVSVAVLYNYVVTSWLHFSVNSIPHSSKVSAFETSWFLMDCDVIWLMFRPYMTLVADWALKIKTWSIQSIFVLIFLLVL